MRKKSSVRPTLYAFSLLRTGRVGSFLMLIMVRMVEISARTSVIGQCHIVTKPLREALAFMQVEESSVSLRLAT
jgi:hypothetical protein